MGDADFQRDSGGAAPSSRASRDIDEVFMDAASIVVQVSETDESAEAKWDRFCLNELRTPLFRAEAPTNAAHLSFCDISATRV